MTPERLREAAARFRQGAAHLRKLVEQEEREGGGYARLPMWAETKAALLDLANAQERDAEEAERRATATDF